jgi:hypothetical protein
MKPSEMPHIYEDVSHFTLAELEELRRSSLASSASIPHALIEQRIATLRFRDMQQQQGEYGSTHWGDVTEDRRKSEKEFLGNLLLTDYFLDSLTAEQTRRNEIRFETNRELNAIPWVGDKRERWTGIEAGTQGSTKTREEWDISAREARKDIRALFRAGLVNREDAKEFNAAAREISISARRNDREGFIKAQERLERAAEDSPALQDVACQRLAICEFDNDIDLARPMNVSPIQQDRSTQRVQTRQSDEGDIISPVSLSVSFRTSHTPTDAVYREREEHPSPMVQWHRVASIVSSIFAEPSPRMA